MTAPTTAMPSALLSLDDIAAIELPILRRISEITGGDHHSRTHGTGFDIVGLRDWQAGDRFNAIDWAQSSLNNFSPMVVREFEQPSIAPVIAIADGSASTAAASTARRLRPPSHGPSPPRGYRRRSFRIRSG